MGQSQGSEDNNQNIFTPEQDILYYKRCIDLSEQYYGKDHITAVHALESLGKNYQKIGEHEQARDCILKAANIKIHSRKQTPGFENERGLEGSQIRAFKDSGLASNIRRHYNQSDIHVHPAKQEFPSFRDNYQERSNEPVSLVNTQISNNGYNNSNLQNSNPGIYSNPPIVSNPYEERAIEPSQKRFINPSQSQTTGGLVASIQSNIEQQYEERAVEQSMPNISSMNMMLRTSCNNAAARNQQSRLQNSMQNMALGSISVASIRQSQQHQQQYQSQSRAPVRYEENQVSHGPVHYHETGANERSNYSSHGPQRVVQQVHQPQKYNTNRYQDIFLSLSEVINLQNDRQEMEKELQFYRFCLQLSREMYGDSHYTAVYILQCLGATYNNLGMGDEAQGCFEQQQYVKSQQNVPIRVSENCPYFYQQCMDKSYQMFLSYKHHTIAFLLQLQAWSFFQKGEYKNAIGCAKKSLYIIEQALGSQEQATQEALQFQQYLEQEKVNRTG